MILRLNLFLAFALFAPAGANAYCFQSPGYDFASSINGSLDYLICLHNEQNTALNDQADTISNNAEIFNDAMRRQNRIAIALDDLTTQFSEITYQNQQLDRQLRALENRINDLEYQ